MVLDHANSPIAVIGLWCAVPQAETPAQFWQNLMDGVESISTLNGTGFGGSRFWSKREQYIGRKGVLERADWFDAAFFGFTPAEATLTDPQHRLFLECVWYAIADAGYNPKNDLGSVGVYATQSNNSYRAELERNNDIDPVTEFRTDIGNSMAHLAANVSYRLGFRGPSLTIQTACSSSLVAVHLACQSLRAGDCEMAVAGGASVTWPQNQGYIYEEGGIMSKDGHCRPFDARASGTVRGEGVGAVVLKRLDDAKAARDHVYAVILSTAINNDGRERAGYTAPGVAGQTEVIKSAVARAGIRPETVGYVETHGTATPLGDAIEIAAIKEALGDAHDGPRCRLGALKANIGHLDAASGIVALIKACYVVKEGRVPAAINFETSQPVFKLDQSRFTISNKCETWECDGPRRAGISSFGLGGTNAHAIIEEPSAVKGTPSARTHQLVVLSAQDPDSLNRLASQVKHALRSRTVDLADVAYTLAVGRPALQCRRAFVVKSVEELCDRLSAETNSDASSRPIPVAPVFVFPGATPDAMSWIQTLRADEQVFRRWFDTCAEKVLAVSGVNVKELLGAGTTKSKRSPAAGDLFLLCAEIALARTLMAWGVMPKTVAGVGVGEYAAAFVSGAFSVEEVLALMHARQMIADQPGANQSTLSETDLSPLVDALAMSVPREPSVVWISSVDATANNVDKFYDKEYWANTLANNWKVQEILRRAITPDSLMFEVGPVSEVSESARTMCSESAGSIPGFTADGMTSPSEILLSALAAFWQRGISINWKAFYGNELRARISLPSARLRATIFAPLHSGSTPEPVRSGGDSDVNGDVGEVTTGPFSLPALEQVIIDAMKQALGLAEVSSNDDFFEIGGCSLTAVQVISQLNETLGRDTPLRLLFQHPRARELATVINERSDETATSVTTVSQPPANVCRTVEALAREQRRTFSLCFFSADAESSDHSDRYKLILQATRFADENGFEAVWIPERHFHRFGGLFPSPSVLGAALAMATNNIAIRAGSVVLPLHHPIAVVEDWAVVDNLARGRVGISFAPGFHPVDYLLRPEAYRTRREGFFEQVELVRGLWRGEDFSGTDGMGRAVNRAVMPPPIQRELPTWITASETEQTFLRAGQAQANVLTALLAMDKPALAKRIASYRNAIRAHHPEKRGKVTLMLHAYVHPDPDMVREKGIAALRQYLATHLEFSSTRTQYEHVTALNAPDREALLDHAVQRYLRGNCLIGTPEHCRSVVNELFNLDVDEIACLIDFGIECDAVLDSLVHLNELRKHFRTETR